jgi:V/A-type H+-transporting ATPase subunit D
MASAARTSPTRGALVRLRTNLEFVQNGLNVLKLKRDRLAEELNLLLKEMNGRDKAEEQLMSIYSDFKTALAMQGNLRVRSAAYSVEKMKVNVNELSIMNVLVPKMRIDKKPSMSVIQDPSLYKVAEKMITLIDEWLDVARVEASIERIAYELTLVNRKVNALEKVVIPSYSTQIKYIEEFLSDEELEDFTRIKRLKAMSRETKT